MVKQRRPSPSRCMNQHEKSRTNCRPRTRLTDSLYLTYLGGNRPDFRPRDPTSQKRHTDRRPKLLGLWRIPCIVHDHMYVAYTYTMISIGTRDRSFCGECREVLCKDDRLWDRGSRLRCVTWRLILRSSFWQAIMEMMEPIPGARYISNLLFRNYGDEEYVQPYY